MLMGKYCLFYQLSPGVSFSSFFKISCCELRLIFCRVMIAKVVQQKNAFLHAPNGIPQSILNAFCYGRKQAVGRIRMPCMAPVTDDVSVFDSRKHAMTFR